jgi:polyribonucleotide nucleotidyltransferase
VKKIIKQCQFGEHLLTIETGEIARQADGAVLVSLNGTVLLVTAVFKKEVNPSQDFFPLTVNYQEKYYAAGQIPGGFLKREGRPSEYETLVSRLIDRPIRPLFPEGFFNEVQVIATLVSYNPEVPADVLALVGASAALAISGAPFMGPIGAARVGYKDGVYLLNPSWAKLEESELDLVVSGTEKAILMVESQAKELSEDVMLGAVLFGHEMMQSVIKIINEMAKEVREGDGGKVDYVWEVPVVNEAFNERLKEVISKDVGDAYLIRDKQVRNQQLKIVRDKAKKELTAENEAWTADDVANGVEALESKIVRERILAGEPRIDGRDLFTVRPISVRTSVLPRTHGSALFTRGETQALVVATLGNERDAQMIDSVDGQRYERFMLHYNFPGYSVGETSMSTSPKRREIGHGNLARRGVAAVLPSEKEFPYVMRVVSEITESNGSSSMASVCGTSLALMDAGVPIKAPVAGVAMGLILEGDKFAVITDILGDEDHLGDMDFKVAGTKTGITALQMDIKVDGITQEIMETALTQALAGRLHILDIMNNAIDEPRQEMSAYAPRIETMKIHPDKIRDVIGKGGVVIKGITESTGVVVDITDDGVIKLFSSNLEALQEAKDIIRELTAEVEIGKTYHGKVNKIVDFGAFITLIPGRDGLLHISQICDNRSEKVTDRLQEGEPISVYVEDIDRQGRIKLVWKKDASADHSKNQDE